MGQSAGPALNGKSFPTLYVAANLKNIFTIPLIH